MGVEQKMIVKLKNEIKDATIIEFLGFVSSVITIITCIITLNIFNFIDKLGSIVVDTHINIDLMILKIITMLCVVLIWLIFSIVMYMFIRESNSKKKKTTMYVLMASELLVTGLMVLGLNFVLKV